MREKGEATLDRWTAVHFATGYALGKIAKPSTALLCLIGFEVFEAFLRGNPDKVPGFVPKGYLEHESERNIVADVVAGWAGYGLSRIT
jgi:hypothetical protein